MFRLNTTLLLKVVFGRHISVLLLWIHLAEDGDQFRKYYYTILILFECHIFKLHTLSHLMDITYSFRLTGFGLPYAFTIFV